MESIQLLVLGDQAGLTQIDDLKEALVKEQCVPVSLSIVDPLHLSLSDFPQESVFVLIHPDPACLHTAVKRLRHQHQEAAILFLDLFNSQSIDGNLLAAGFDDYLSCSLSGDALAARVMKNLSKVRGVRAREAESVKRQLTLEVELRELVGKGPSIAWVLQQIKTLSDTAATILITGETGTGKDLCARAIHYAGARAGKPFLPVNCGGIPDELFENQFFGHERGAYTDAREKQGGLVQEAEGGTIFLDDVESLSIRNQVKLLRFLEGNGYSPLGSSKLIQADVRIIAATNADLLQKARAGMFREDLFFRLAVLTLTIPPLRARAEDIPELADHFIGRFCSYYNKPRVALSEVALGKLLTHPWPGNVRELENVIHRAVVHARSPIVADIALLDDETLTAPQEVRAPIMRPFSLAKREAVAQFERRYVEQILRECSGNISEAARRAGKHRRAFWEIMRKHRISPTH